MEISTVVRIKIEKCDTAYSLLGELEDVDSDGLLSFEDGVLIITSSE